MLLSYASMMESHRRRGLWLLWLGFAIALPAHASEPRVDAATAALMVSMHRVHEDHTALAAIAEEGAERGDVRAFAAKLRRDHAARGAELAELAEELKVDLEPQRPEVASAKEREASESLCAGLEEARGADLDRIYLQAVIDISRSQSKRLRREGPRVEHRKVKEHAAAARRLLDEQIAKAADLQRIYAVSC